MRIIRTLLCCLVVLGASATARAEPITLLVNGTIDSFVRGGVIEDMPIGAGFSLLMTWESNTPASSWESDLANYEGALTRFTAAANNFTFTLSPQDASTALTVTNRPWGDSLAGAITETTLPTSVDGLSAWHARWELVFPSDTWNSTALPTSIPSTLERGWAKLNIYNHESGEDIVVHASLTRAETVPEPGTLAVFGMGLAGAARLARRRRAAATVA